MTLMTPINKGFLDPQSPSGVHNLAEIRTRWHEGHSLAALIKENILLNDLEYVK